MRRSDRLEAEALQSRYVRLRRRSADLSPCLGRDWYEICLDCIAELDYRATHHADLNAAFTTWCEFCSAVSIALNNESATMTAEGVDYLNAPPIAAWLLRQRTGRRD